jgi:hypothetical protein
MREEFLMFFKIPAKIENGKIIPVAEIPESELIRHVAILVEVEDAQYKNLSVSSCVERLRGILKEDSDSDYVNYLENKYQ